MGSNVGKIALFAVAAAGLVVVLPWILPTGIGSGVSVESYLTSGRLLAAGGLVFVGGLLTALTPCVYPLIPITMSVFGATKAHSRGKAFLLTGSYVLGMAAVFSALSSLASGGT